MTQFLQLPVAHLGAGALAKLGEELGRLKMANPLFVTDRGIVACGGFDRVRTALGEGFSGALFDEIPENPTFDGVDHALAHYRTRRCDGVVAIGGGSVIDSAKIVAVLAGQGGCAADIVGFSERIIDTVAPLIVVPTTAGTGSEASPDAGIHPDAATRSSGVTSRYVIPKVAICDPHMTLTLPPRLTAGTGLDALSHCIEGFLAVPESPLIEALALDGIRRVCRFLRVAARQGDDVAARTNVMIAAFEGGVAIGKGLGPAHAIAISCGDQGLHHGLLSALGVLASLPLSRRHAPAKLDAIAGAMDLQSASEIEPMLRRLMQDLGLPLTLREAGYRVGHMAELAQACATSHFNLTSPYRPTERDFGQMLSMIH
jgi:alcohol dehydrogenase class IV